MPMPDAPQPAQPRNVTELADQFGGYWGKHPTHTVESWQYEVANNDTRQSYWEWVAEQVADEAIDTEYRLRHDK